MNLNSIPAFQDNYIWVLNNEQGRCVLVDPGEAAPALKIITNHQWRPEAILLTHHHQDHVGGVKELIKHFPDLVVYGPPETQNKGANHIVAEGDELEILHHKVNVIATPGHTAGHISYFTYPWLFCGDTMFSGGCGRLFEGTAYEMYQSFQKINALPDETLICCAHEYTLSNLLFALSILPEDKALNEYYLKVKALRAKKQTSLPSTLQTERKINLFLRTEETVLKQKNHKDTKLQQPWQIFRWLRVEKDNF